jgi:hypothetical protein
LSLVFHWSLRNRLSRCRLDSPQQALLGMYPQGPCPSSIAGSLLPK